MVSKKKKTVVLLVPGFPANEQDTTCIPFLQQFCLAFLHVRPDIELRVLSFQYPHKKGYYLWNGIKVYCAGGKSHKNNRIFTWIKIFIQFLNIRRQHDIVVINSFWITECAFLGQWISRIFNIKHIVYVVGQDALISNKYLRLIDFSKMKIIAMCERLTTHFFQSTGYKIQHIIPVGMDMENLKVLYEQRTINILGVGSLIPLKNYLLFTEIVYELKKDFPEIKACIIGKGGQEQAIKEKIKAYGLEKTLDLLGEVPHKEVFSYMQRSKIFLHTSSYEGQSMVITEALACGLNIVCFNIGRVAMEGKIWVCKNKEEMLIALKKLIPSPLTYEPVISITSDDTVKEFLKVYEI